MRVLSTQLLLFAFLFQSMALVPKASGNEFCESLLLPEPVQQVASSNKSVLKKIRDAVFATTFSLCTLAGCGPSNETHTPIHRDEVPHAVIRSEEGKKWLEVDGKPFLVTAVEPDNWAMQTPGPDAAKQFEWAARVNANTIVVNIFWAKVETGKDQYDMSYVDWVLEQARIHDLKLVLGWFGSNTVGKTNERDLTVVPDYISTQPEIYSRVYGDWIGIDNVLDPADPETYEREAMAFQRVLQHVERADTDRRVIMWKVLNEVGVMPLANRDMGRTEAELTDQLVAYLDGLTFLSKVHHGVPTYMNFWEGLLGAKPFAFLNGIPDLDFVGPDLYGDARGPGIGDIRYREFRELFLEQMERYKRPRNVLFLPETNTDEYFRTHLSPFYIFGSNSGLGLSVWAITTGSHSNYEPLIGFRNPFFFTGDYVTGSGERLAEVYGAFNGAHFPIVDAQGTNRIGSFVAEVARSGELTVDGIRMEIEGSPQGAVLAAKVSGGPLVLIGRFSRVILPVSYSSRIESGSYDGQIWTERGTAETSVLGDGRHVIDFHEAQVVRISR